MTMPDAVKPAARPSAFARSPAGLFVILMVSLFLVELIVMLLQPMLPKMPSLVTDALDATLLVVLAFPALRAFAFEPLLGQLRLREAVEARLQETNRTLEHRVQERTRKLQTANDAVRVEIAEHKRLQQDYRCYAGKNENTGSSFGKTPPTASRTASTSSPNCES